MKIVTLAGAAALVLAQTLPAPAQEPPSGSQRNYPNSRDRQPNNGNYNNGNYNNGKYNNGNYSNNSNGNYNNNNNNNWNNGGGNYSGDTVRCESKEYRYKECPADVRGGVRLNKTLGGDCREGRSWGTRNAAIWVDKGCRGEFQLRYGQNYNNNNNSGGTSAGDVVAGVAAAAGAAALIAAATSGGKKKSDSSTAAPPTAPPPATAPAAPPPPPAPVNTGQPTKNSVNTGGVLPDARPSLQVCLNEVAAQIGRGGGTEIQLDRFDEVTPGNGGYRFKMVLKAIYPNETRAVAVFCRATPTKLVELTFG